MPTFEITSPDGRRFRIDAPEGATQDDVMAYARANTPEAPKAEQTGPLDTMAMGAGRTLDRWAAGLRSATPEPIRNAIDWTNNKLGMGQVPSIDRATQDENTRIFNEGPAKQNPVSAFVGETLPALPVANPIGMAALGALEYGTPTERATRAGLGYAGGKVGQALGAGVSRLFGPESASIAPKLSDEFFANSGNKWGIPLSVGQRTQSKPAQIIESVVRNMPGGSGVMADATDRTFGAFNKAIGQTFGSDTASLTPEVLGSAKKRIGAAFNDLAERNRLQIDEPLYNESLRIAERANTELTPEHAKIAKNWLDKVWRDGGKDMTLPGTLYKAYDSQLGKLSKSSGGTLGNVLGDLRGVLRDAMDRSISPADQKAWQTARREYLNLQTVADATKNMTGEVGDSLSPARLLQAVNASQKNARFGSGNDLAELAQWAKGTLPDKIPNSGTAQRLLYQSLLAHPMTTLGAVGGLGYGAQQAGIGGPEAALAIPLAYATARGMGGKPVSAATEELLKRLGGGLLGLPALTYDR